MKELDFARPNEPSRYKWEEPTREKRLPAEPKTLCVLDNSGSYAIPFADLLHGELASANAASPARGRRLHDSGHRVLIFAPS